ncbi:NAD-glutamate dehydrogenase [Sinorhizobium sp. BG8]|uniref:NAD-glutamate dehydrogenase n=1 Tax=Sinorhizobium sp. BG8 TaxID=2613773 RepID=UPI00193DD2F1|nr:NAD-glutamate dehydrogenase [Sinorhizobium sp. BG8]QRM53618.1 NAD-glutamate dehydrogenase [Sinorhizobium sp. BG8]
MSARSNTKREKLIEATALSAKAQEGALSPEVLFSRASNDDLEAYSPQMLEAAAVHAFRELHEWTGTQPRVTVTTLPDIAPQGAPVSVLAVTDRNMPFLYDSVMGEVTSTHRDIHLAIHPILVLQPGKAPVLFSPDDSSDPAHRVSHIQIHIRELAPSEAALLAQRIEHVLTQVHLAVGDWQSMRDKLDAAVADIDRFGPVKRKAEKEEALAFLSWLRDNNFTFLGMRDYVYKGKGEKAAVERDEGAGLGILSDPDVRVLRFGKDAVTTTPEIIEFLEGPDFLIVTKANVKSVVHRRAYMDYVGVKRFDEDGNVVGELRIVGLFTSTAYTHTTSEIPLLRSKIAKVIDHFGYDPQSHSGKMLINTLESYPRDDLFQIDVGLLSNFCEQINELADRPRIRVLARIDHFDRFVSVLVYVPREQYDSDVREKIGNYLKTVYDGRVSAYYPAFPEGGLARVHFIIGRSGGKTPRISQQNLERAIRDIATRWSDRFEALTGSDSARLTTDQGFQEDFTPAEAFADLGLIEAVTPQSPIRISFYHKTGHADPSKVELKIFHAGGAVSLSQRVPLLENLGFRVISEQTHTLVVRPLTGEDRIVVLHDMELQQRDGLEINIQKTSPVLEESFLSAWHGLIDDDTFNRLVLTAELGVREIVVLRSYARYLRQTGITYSQGYIADTLNKYPAIAADIFRLFSTRLEPGLAERKRSKRSAEIAQAIEDALVAVPSLDDDRILRRFVNAVQSTLRTNYFQRDADGRPLPALAFKLDPKTLEGLPDPRPFREIFVYGAEVEGVHLRFGPIARGGLRWSDRAEDYRTEVLGLVKAQQVKNSVIVPVGAKGGFYPKQLPAGGNRDAIFRAGTEAYKTFIRTLLSVTDNIVGQDVVPPRDTVRLDADDPYFVVAADKGTATFSDTANGLAQEAGFWLDDAFASGGSAGYDHKKMGITARGAWEAVKRHFREMDVDIQTAPFTAVGVGDMSGDVFGNGMLLSRKTRLVAAFDHRDIFIDPNPDIEKSFAERKRLFALPRSSWNDYDRQLLSNGGMIISRAEKSVSLSNEARAALGIDKQKATPFEIMTAILKAPVDLLWFGGIGTYVRAAGETDAEVGDRANDAIRIIAQEVRAKVIGEGANLGVTQKGRIAYGLAGGRCNSDAIDNSAGVNSSDVEVNIKIALASAMRDNRLTRPKRDVLLSSMTDEVAQLVLRNNYLQPLAISMTELQGTANRLELSRLMSKLEAAGQLNRQVESLPDEQTMSERYQAGKPLTRAEIGVLLSYAKIVLSDELIHSDLPDDPYFEPTLLGYFPKKMQKTYGDDIRSHRLRREIIATLLANEAINRGGPAFVTNLTDGTGFVSSAAVKAAIIARDGFGLQALYAAVDSLDNKVSGAVQNELYEELGRIFSLSSGVLMSAASLAMPTETAVSRLRQALKQLRPHMATLVPERAEGGRRKRIRALEDKGVPGELVSELADLSAMTFVPEIMQIAGATGESLLKTAQTYTGIASQLNIDRLLVAAARVPTTDSYENLALQRSLNDISAARRDLTVSVLGSRSGHKSPIAAWQEEDRERLAKIGGRLASLTEAGEATLAKIAVAAGVLSDLARDRAR